MNDLELTEQLTTFHREGSGEAVPPGLREAVMSIPSERGRPVARLRPALTWRLFAAPSAATLAAAAVVAMLLGGLLLAGVLIPRADEGFAPASVSDSPAPPSTAELLSSMVTEEVEPGVLRIVDDGYREMGRPRTKSALAEAVVVDPSGGVWRVTQVGEDWSAEYFRLGQEEEQLIGPGSRDYEELTHAALNFVATPDGRLLSPYSDDLVLVEGEAATPAELGLRDFVRAIGVQDDGTIWLLADENDLVRATPDGVPEAMGLTDVHDGYVERLVVTPGGEVWLASTSGVGQDARAAFLHFDGHEWEVVPVPEEVARPGYAVELDAGSDGTLWASADVADDNTVDNPRPRLTLARYDDSGWTIFGESDGVRPWGSQGVGPYDWPFDLLQVAPDGTAWVNAWADTESGRCGGLGRFDGTTWSDFLMGSCISDYDFAPDGAVWVVAEDRQAGSGFQTYVITPDAIPGQA